MSNWFIEMRLEQNWRLVNRQLWLLLGGGSTVLMMAAKRPSSHENTDWAFADRQMPGKRMDPSSRDYLPAAADLAGDFPDSPFKPPTC